MIKRAYESVKSSFANLVGKKAMMKNICTSRFAAIPVALLAMIIWLVPSVLIANDNAANVSITPSPIYVCEGDTASATGTVSPSGQFNRVTFVMENTATATVTPGTASSGVTNLTITGVKAGITNLKGFVDGVEKTSVVVNVIKLDSIDGLVYGESGRKIVHMESLANPANVVASGYMKFQATILPSSVTNALYYKWTVTAGTLINSEGMGNDYLSVKWDAPDGHQQSVTLKLEIKTSAYGTIVCTETVELMTVRPYVVRVKFVDDFWNEEQQISDGGDPEFDAVAGKSYPVCYVMKRGMQVQVDLAGQKDNDSVNNLTKKTEIRISATAVYGGIENKFDEDSMDEKTEDWSAKDYDTVEIESDDNVPDKVTEYEDFEMHWTIKVKNSSGAWIPAYKRSGRDYSQMTEHYEPGTGGKNYGLYLIYDVQKCVTLTAFKKEVLDYACNWANGKNEEESIITDLLANGFSAHYVYNLDCRNLSSDFVHLCRNLGIVAETHFWGNSSFNSNGSAQLRRWEINDMLNMASMPISTVGNPGTQRWVWSFHQWASANGKTRDPSAGKSFDGDWREYEDFIFEKRDPPGGYERVMSLISTWWDPNQPGQSTGCESHGVSGPGMFSGWSGPTGP